MKQEAMSPAASANYYNPYGVSSFQQPMYPGQGERLYTTSLCFAPTAIFLGFANYPVGNGFYHSYAPMGWNAPQYGYPTPPMQQDYCGWQQQQHQQQQQQARPDQQIYSDVNALKRSVYHQSTNSHFK